MITGTPPDSRPRDSSWASDGLLVGLTIGASLLSMRNTQLIGFAIVPLTIVALVAWRRWPWIWIAGSLLATVLALLRWWRYEDHVFFGTYLLLAIGIALTRDDFRDSFAVQARWLVGALFGTAVVWKVVAASFRSGEMFRTVLLRDARFDPITRLVGGVDSSTLLANRDSYDAVAADPNLVAAPLLASGELTTLAILLGLWTIAIEVAIATSFLAPDTSRLSRLRHPSLLAFGVTTYAVLPVLGFAIMLGVAGLAQRHRPGVQWAYILMMSAPIIRAFQIAL